MAKSLTEMAAEIVAAQARHTTMSTEEMDTSLKKTFEALKRISAAEGKDQPTEKKYELAKLRANPKKSIQRSFIINLEDGKTYKQLTARTLARFGLTPREYRKKWGFSMNQPLAPTRLTAERRETIKALGLPGKLQTARKAKARIKSAKKVARKKRASRMK
jgi:predicted transcriptional regulator